MLIDSTLLNAAWPGHTQRKTGYFPGAQDLTLRLVYDKEKGGKLLGAQAFGRAGVEKRVDAAAIGACVRALPGLPALRDTGRSRMNKQTSHTYVACALRPSRACTHSAAGRAGAGGPGRGGPVLRAPVLLRERPVEPGGLRGHE